MAAREHLVVGLVDVERSGCSLAFVAKTVDQGTDEAVNSRKRGPLIFQVG